MPHATRSHVEILAESTPKTIADVEWSLSKSHESFRIVVVIGKPTVAILAHVTPLALMARHIFFESDEVALVEAPEIFRTPADLFYSSDVFMAQDSWIFWHLTYVANVASISTNSISSIPV